MRNPKVPQETTTTVIEILVNRKSKPKSSSPKEIAEKLGREKAFPDPAPRTDAWYRARRAELQRQKVELFAKFGKKAA